MKKKRDDKTTRKKARKEDENHLFLEWDDLIKDSVRVRGWDEGRQERWRKQQGHRKEGYG